MKRAKHTFKIKLVAIGGMPTLCCAIDADASWPGESWQIGEEVEVTVKKIAPARHQVIQERMAREKQAYESGREAFGLGLKLKDRPEHPETSLAERMRLRKEWRYGWKCAAAGEPSIYERQS
jgi:hypothetical protein